MRLNESISLRFTDEVQLIYLPENSWEQSLIWEEEANNLYKQQLTTPRQHTQ